MFCVILLISIFFNIAKCTPCFSGDCGFNANIDTENRNGYIDYSDYQNPSVSYVQENRIQDHDEYQYSGDGVDPDDHFQATNIGHINLGIQITQPHPGYNVYIPVQPPQVKPPNHVKPKPSNGKGPNHGHVKPTRKPPKKPRKPIPGRKPSNKCTNTNNCVTITNVKPTENSKGKTPGNGHVKPTKRPPKITKKPNTKSTTKKPHVKFTSNGKCDSENNVQPNQGIATTPKTTSTIINNNKCMSKKFCTITQDEEGNRIETCTYYKGCNEAQNPKGNNKAKPKKSVNFDKVFDNLVKKVITFDEAILMHCSKYLNEVYEFYGRDMYTLEYKLPMGYKTEDFDVKAKHRVIYVKANNQQLGYNTYTYNDTAHTEREQDEILAVTYDDGKWSKPYYDCGGGNIWMLTYTVPFFGYSNGTYFFKGTSGIDIDLRRVDIDQCPLKPGSTQLNIFAGTDKCKKSTTECVPVPGLGFRRGSYRCVCRRGFYFPNTTAENRFYNGSVIEEEYEKHLQHHHSLYSKRSAFQCLPCAEGCEACIDGSPCVAALNWVVRTTIFALACLVISCLPFIVYFTIKYGHVRVVRAASPALLRVIVLGALLIYCTTLVMYGRPTVFTCTARVWLREVGFCLTYGALMLKTWRISVIFQVRSAKAVKISDMYLLRRIGVIVGVACVLLSIRTLVAPPAVIVGRTKEDLKAYLCNTDWWDHSFTTLEVIFLMWGIRLCIMVRKAPSEFNESRFISMAIYNEFLLSVFLNISMLFLQSPANPDLLYIIFFCHTQLTVTLLLCFIFGSKAYMVYKGQGKDDREKTGKFRSKPAESTYTMTTNRSTRFCDNMTERELEEEFKKICNQLEKLRERCIPVNNIPRKITAMLDAAALHERKPGASDSAPLKLNTVFSAVADRLMCTVTPAEESSSSGRDLPFDAPPSYKQKFTPTKSVENSNAEQSQTDVTTDSPKRKTEEEKENGVFKISGEANCGDIRPPEVNRNGYKNDKREEVRCSPSSSEVRSVRSGHARTHAIVINLDDKSRFTEEVTV
ncbi:unnamed protein product [Colias eurytheme]|nr:unnamed protein product [Colias eurytheme]